jgi:hypothetical protein
VLGREPVVDVKGDAAHVVRDAPAPVGVGLEAAKDPAAAVVVDVGGPEAAVGGGGRLVDADGDGAPRHGARGLGDDEVARVNNLAPKRDGVPGRVPAEVLNGHLVRGQAAGVVPAVILHEGGVVPGQQIRCQAVVQRLLDDDGRFGGGRHVS